MRQFTNGLQTLPVGGPHPEKYIAAAPFIDMSVIHCSFNKQAQWHCELVVGRRGYYPGILSEGPGAEGNSFQSNRTRGGYSHIWPNGDVPP